MFMKHNDNYDNHNDLSGLQTKFRVNARHFFPPFSMQKMLFPAVLAAALLSACTMSGTTDTTGSGTAMSSSSMVSSSSTTTSTSSMEAKANMVGVTMRGGVMYTLWSDGKIQELTEDMVLSNGTVVKKDGTVMLVGGKTQTMVDGDMVTREGAMTTDDSAAMRDGADQE